MARTTDLDKPLTPKDRRFCEEYVANGYNAGKAYGVSHPDVSKSTCANSGYRLLKDPRICAYIQELEKDTFEANRINAEHIANELATIAFGEVTSKSRLGYSDKTKALELLAKQINLYTEKIDANISGQVVFVDDMAKPEEDN